MNIAVVDTHVLVSGALSPHGAPGRIVDLLREGAICAAINDRIWDEYEEVLRRPAFGFDPRDVENFLKRLRDHAIHAPSARVKIRAQALPDPDDAPFLECAMALDAPLITGNLKHYPRSLTRGVDVLSPAAYLRRFNRKSA